MAKSHHVATLCTSLSAAWELLGRAPSRARRACWGRLAAKPGAGSEPAGIPHAQWGWAHGAEVAGPDFEGYLGHVNEFWRYPGIVWGLSSAGWVTFVGSKDLSGSCGVVCGSGPGWECMKVILW